MKVNQLKGEQISVLLSSLQPETARKLLEVIEHGGLQKGDSDAVGIIAAHLQELLNGDDAGNQEDQDSSKAGYSKVSGEDIQEPPSQFSIPFDDLLVEDILPIKQAGRISQNSVKAVWIWLMRDLLSDELPVLVESVATSERVGDNAGLSRNIKSMHIAIASALEEQLTGLDPHSSAYMKLASHVGGAQVLEDCREMLLTIKLEYQIEQVRAKLPIQIHSLRAGEVKQYIRIYKEFNEQTDGFGWLALLTIMARLKQPAEIIWLVTKIVGTNYETDLRAHKTALVCECAMHDMESAARKAAKMISEQKEIEVAFVEIDKFYILADEFSSELDIDLKGEWGVNLIRVRSILAEAIRSQISDAPRRVKAVLFCDSWRYTDSEAKSTQQIKAPDEADLRSAEFSVRLLQGLRQYLEQLPINAEYTALNDQVLQFIERIGDAVVGKIREADNDEKEVVDAYLKANIYFTKMVFGQEAADLMRRQAYVAGRVNTPETETETATGS